MGATKIYELDTAKDRDAQAVFERGEKLQEELKSGKADSQLYHGEAGYRKFIKARVRIASMLPSWNKVLVENVLHINESNERLIQII